MSQTAPIRQQQVVVVLPPRTMLLDLAGPLEVLRRANFEQSELEFEVEVVAVRPAVRSSVGLQLAGLRPLPEQLAAQTIVLLVGNVEQLAFTQAEATPERDAADAQTIVDWLRAVVGPSQRLVCVCSGALLAARAGLLDGYNCTTHHALCEELQALAPRARVLHNRLFVEDGPRLTSAGVTAGTDLLLHVVQNLTSPSCAAAIARQLVLYLRRSGADPQLSPWLIGRNHLHAAVHRIQDVIAADPAHDHSLEQLATFAHSSPRHLSRLFNLHTGMSLSDYRNGLRIALVRQMLEHSQLNLERIAERCGFASTRHLRRAWHRCYSEPPSLVRKTGG